MPRIQHIIMIAAVTLATGSPVLAQATATAPARKTVITFNPFALFAEYVAGDVETTVSPSVTIGIGGSAVGIRDFNNYRALEAKVRYYPNELALQGFSVAASAGVATARGDSGGQGTSTRFTRPTIGTELSYQWLLGPSHRFVTVLGIGVKRYLGTEGSFDPINIPLLPTARANIGFAF